MINGNHAVGVSLHLSLCCLFETKKRVSFSERTNSFLKINKTLFKDLEDLKQKNILYNPNRDILYKKEILLRIQKDSKNLILFLEKEKDQIPKGFKNIIVNTEILLGIVRKIDALLTTIITTGK
ncbi:MAG: hypothetical protein WCQ32_03085 [bacterium]